MAGYYPLTGRWTNFRKLWGRYNITFISFIELNQIFNSIHAKNMVVGGGRREEG